MLLHVFLLCTSRTQITRFSKVSTQNIFTFFQPQPELVLKLFLIFGQSESHCSYKVIKKSVSPKRVMVQSCVIGHVYMENLQFGLGNITPAKLELFPNNFCGFLFILRFFIFLIFQSFLIFLSY